MVYVLYLILSMGNGFLCWKWKPEMSGGMAGKDDWRRLSEEMADSFGLKVEDEGRV